jgi:hypothetical protein
MNGRTKGRSGDNANGANDDSGDSEDGDKDV